MTKQIGRLASFGIGRESTRGTSVAPTYWIPWMELDVDDRVAAVTNEVSRARLEQNDGMAIVEKYMEGSVKTKLMSNHIGLLLYSIFGTVSSATKGGETVVYEHTYSVEQGTQHDSLTFAYKDANKDVRFANGMVSDLKITAELGNYIMYEASILAKNSASASNTVSHSAEYEFVPQMLTFKKASAQSGLTAASASTIRACEINFRQNALREHVLGSVAPNDVLNQGFEVFGKITLVNDATTFEDLQNNETQQAFRFDFTHTSTIGNSSNPRLLIDLHSVRLTNYSRSLTLNGLVEESFDFQGNYYLTDSKLVTCVLTNLIASY